MDINAVLAVMTPERYQQFKTAIELRKWPDGRALTTEQVQVCLQAVIAYEHAHLPKEQHTGYVPPKETACQDDSHIHTREEPISWKTPKGNHEH